MNTSEPCPILTSSSPPCRKDRGQKLGGFRGPAGTAEDMARARKAHTEKSRGYAASLAPILSRLDTNGSMSLRALAAKLTAEDLPTQLARLYGPRRAGKGEGKAGGGGAWIGSGRNNRAASVSPVARSGPV